MESVAQVLLSLFVSYWVVVAAGAVLSVVGVLSMFMSRKELVGILASAAAFGGLAFLVHRLIWNI